MQLDLQMKILIVEDFGFTRRIETRALNKIGFFNIVEAPDGKAAIEMLRSDDEIRLIISDWNMPSVNGYELLKWVRASEKHAELPFIMVTAQAEKEDMKRVMEAGANGFLTKPFTFEEVSRVIEEALDMAEREVREIPQKTPTGKVQLSVGHIQITDHLVLGVLKHLIGTGALTPRTFELEPKCMSGWNPVQRAVEEAEVDAAFIMAPIAMDIFSAGAPIKLVLLAHRNGSICVRNKPSDGGRSYREFCKDKVFYIPHVLSVHHMLSRMMFERLGLSAGLVGHEDLDVTFEVIPPVMMPEFLTTSKDSCGFMVAQPIGTKTVFDNDAEMVFLSGQVWERHPCCVVVMQDKIIEANPEVVQEFTDLLVKAGDFIEANPEKAAEIAVDFLDPEEELQLSVPILKSVLSEQHGVSAADLYPLADDFRMMQKYMVETMGVGTEIDFSRFIDTRFAEKSCPEPPEGRRPSVIHDFNGIVSQL